MLGRFVASVLPKSITGEVHLPDDKDKSVIMNLKMIQDYSKMLNFILHRHLFRPG